MKSEVLTKSRRRAFRARIWNEGPFYVRRILYISVGVIIGVVLFCF